MKSSPSVIVSLFFVSMSLSTYAAEAQTITDSGNNTSFATTNEPAVIDAAASPLMGKELPVPGAVLYITPAERSGMEKKMAEKHVISVKEKRRAKRLKRQDRREVTQVIGNSVDNYLANVYNVHTLQRF